MHGAVARWRCRPGVGTLPWLAFLLAMAWQGPAMADTFRLGGTGNALATLRTLGEAFARKEPDFTLVVVPNLGSSGGVNALKGGAVELAAVARPLSPAEMSEGLAGVPLGRTPLVIATRHEVAGISLSELADAYAGRLRRWPDNTPVRLVLRPPADSDTTQLRSLSPALDQAVEQAHKREGLLVSITDQEAADALERLPGSLGTATLAIIVSESRRLRALALDGVPPVRNGRANSAYPLFKPLLLATRGEPTGQLGRFIDFVRGGEGTRILERNGYLAAR